MKADVTLDCYGLLCPMPIIQTAKTMAGMKVGEVLEVVSTDRGILSDTYLDGDAARERTQQQHPTDRSHQARNTVAFFVIEQG